MVVYRATPPDVASGVLVGDLEYPGYPAAGASTIEGVKIDDPYRYMENLADPNKLGGGIAVAFVATVYGVGTANLLFLPIASKLKMLIGREVRRREIVADGLLGIANGENPKLIESRLNGYLA